MAETPNPCFGCGPENSKGLRLVFEIVFETEGSPVSRTTLRLGSQYQGGVGFLHGGIIAILMDEAMSKLNRPLGVKAMTRHLTVDYLRPVPVDVLLKLEGMHLRREGRKLFHEAELCDESNVLLAKAEALFIVVGEKGSLPLTSDHKSTL